MAQSPETPEVDPIPDVRATAAKAFGTLANGLPEEMLGDVLPWLFQMLQSPESAVERSGAAHGLSEVLMAMGTERIEMLIPDILNKATNRDAAPEVKEPRTSSRARPARARARLLHHASLRDGVGVVQAPPRGRLQPRELASRSSRLGALRGDLRRRPPHA